MVRLLNLKSSDGGIQILSIYPFPKTPCRTVALVRLRKPYQIGGILLVMVHHMEIADSIGRRSIRMTCGLCRLALLDVQIRIPQESQDLEKDLEVPIRNWSCLLRVRLD